VKEFFVIPPGPNRYPCRGRDTAQRIQSPAAPSVWYPIRIAAFPRNFPDVVFVQLRWSSHSVPKGRIPACRYFTNP
jgi:hypothetical protein